MHAEAVEQLWSELTFLRVSWQQIVRGERFVFTAAPAKSEKRQRDTDTD